MIKSSQNTYLLIIFNFTNILQADFAPIFFRNKNYKAKLKLDKSCTKYFCTKKVACKMLVKLTLTLFGVFPILTRWISIIHDVTPTFPWRRGQRSGNYCYEKMPILRLLLFTENLVRKVQKCVFYFTTIRKNLLLKFTKKSIVTFPNTIMKKPSPHFENEW